MRSARSGSSLMADDPAVRPGDQAVVEGQLVGEVAALGDLDRVHLADQVRDGDVGRRELLRVAPVAADPGDRGRVAVALDDRPRRRADRRERVVVELAAGDDRAGTRRAGRPGRGPSGSWPGRARRGRRGPGRRGSRSRSPGRPSHRSRRSPAGPSRPTRAASSRLARSSSLTVRERHPDARSSAMVVGARRRRHRCPLVRRGVRGGCGGSGRAESVDGPADLGHVGHAGRGEAGQIGPVAGRCRARGPRRGPRDGPPARG